MIVALVDVPARWVMEGGAIMPEPGQEAAWLEIARDLRESRIPFQRLARVFAVRVFCARLALRWTVEGTKDLTCSRLLRVPNPKATVDV
jgi:hypothetical protein